MVLLTVLGYQSPVITFYHGIFNGMMIEGGGRWGYNTIWSNDN